jgi:hypothetical protein
MKRNICTKLRGRKKIQCEIIGLFELYCCPAGAGSSFTDFELLAFGRAARNTKRNEFICFNP